jgi:hypothetical protein
MSNYKDYSYYDLKQYFSEIELFNICYPNLQTGKQCAPHRSDKNPSFGIKYGNNNKLLFNDFGTGDKGGFFDLVQLFENCTFPQAIEYINLCIRTGGHKPILQKPHFKADSEHITLGVHKVPWDHNNALYWLKYGLYKEDLDYYNVSPIDWYYFWPNSPREVAKKADDIAYCYSENKDKKSYLKIYQPYSKTRKWVSNNKADVWENWNQVKTDSDLFILQKSKKDSMCIQKHTPFASANLSAESLYPKPHVLDQVRDRFKNIVILYDNDFTNPLNPGLRYAERLSKIYNLPYVYFPDHLGFKNFSDAIEAVGKTEAVKILNSLL